MCFSSSGIIISCAVNAPGCMRDYQICDWGGLHDRLGNIYNEIGGKVVVDSAFC